MTHTWTQKYSGNHTYLDTGILMESHIPGHWNTQGITHTWTLAYSGNHTYLDTGILKESHIPGH